MEKHIKLMEKARTHLVMMHPFFASVVLRKPITWDESVQTAGVTPTGVMTFAPTFVAGLNVDQLVFLMCHEAMHYLSLHGVRRNGRDHRKWNWAADAVINETLKECGIGQFIDGGVELGGAHEQNAEQVYANMPESNDGSENVLDGDVKEGEGSDNTGAQPLTESEVAALEAQVKLEAAQARRASEMRGVALGSALEAFVNGLIDVTTPWYDVLERYMQGHRADETSWSRPNKRMMHMDIYTPGRGYVPEMGEVVIGVDTSGSIDDQTLRMFGGHIQRILDDCKPSKVHVVYCDSGVQLVEEFQDVEELQMKSVGGGGTAFKPVFDWVADNQIFPDVLVYLTDLYGPTNFEAPGYETIWLTTGSKDAGFGVVLPYTG